MEGLANMGPTSDAAKGLANVGLTNDICSTLHGTVSSYDLIHKRVVLMERTHYL